MSNKNINKDETQNLVSKDNNDVKNNNENDIQNLNQSEKEIHNNNNIKNNFKSLKTNSNLFLYNKLNNKLNEITNENNYLKSEIVSLKNKIINLESDKIVQKHNINDLIQTQNNLLSLKHMIKEKDQIIESLKEQIVSDHKKYNDELRYKESKFDYDLIQSKIQYESAKYKIENYLKIEKYSDALYKKLLQVEEIVNNFNKIEENNMKRQKIEYMNKLNKFKKKMLDFLKKEMNSKESFREQIRLSNLANNLHIQELIKDIEDLNNEVCELLEEKQELKYKIFCLVNDMQTYRKVIDTVILKNSHLEKKFFKKNFSQPLMKFKKFFKDKKNFDTNKNSEEELIEPKIKSNKKLMKLSNSLSLIFNTHNNNKNNIISSQLNKTNELLNSFNANNNITLNKFNSTSYNNFPKYKNNNTNISNCSLIEKQTELIQEKEKYKNYYNFFKEKYNFIKEKYSSIFKIYTEALEKIYNEELSKENNDIFINLNELKNFDFDFEKMNTKQKYFILIKLIKHIAPLICKKEFENNSFAIHALKSQEKFALESSNGKSVSFSTAQNSFDLSLHLSQRYKNYENNKTGSLKIIDKKNRKLNNLFRNKNRHKIFMEFKKNFNIHKIPPLNSIPFNDFYNGPFSSI